MQPQKWSFYFSLNAVNPLIYLFWVFFLLSSVYSFPITFDLGLEKNQGQIIFSLTLTDKLYFLVLQSHVLDTKPKRGLIHNTGNTAATN